MKHIMIDMETMGNESYSAIVSIAALRFDIESGKIFDYYYKIVDLDSCLNAGLKVTGSTIKWWLTKSEEARKGIAKKGTPIKPILKELYNVIDKDDIVWSNGVRFDISLLTDAYNICKMEIPWNWHNERDVRTLAWLGPDIVKECKENHKGIIHNAVDDCILQIDYCSKIYNKIKI